MYKIITIKYAALFMVLALLSYAPPAVHAGTGTLNDPVRPEISDLIPYIEKTLQGDPDNAGLRFVLGSLYIEIGTADTRRLTDASFDPPAFVRAEAELKKSLKLDPSLYLAHYHLGLLAFHRQDMNAAEDHILSALQIQGKDMRLYQKLHTIYLSSLFVQRSANLMAKAVKVLPDEPDLHYRFAISQLIINDLKGAKRSAGRSMALSYSVEANNLLATAEMRQGNLNKAKVEFSRVLRADMKNINAMIGMALVYIASDNDGNAASWLDKVISVDPGNTEAKELLRKIEKQTKQK